MLSCLLLIRVQRAWFSEAAGWKRCLVCDKSNLGLWFIKCLQNNNRKANGSTQGASELCRGEKYSECICRMVTQSSCFVGVLLVHIYSWKCSRKRCFWQRIAKCEPVLKRAHLSGCVFPCILECSLLGQKAALRICSQYFPCVTRPISLSLWDQLCMSVCLVPCSVPLALNNCISGKCFQLWLSDGSAAPAKWYYGLSKWPIKLSLLCGKDRCSYGAGNGSFSQVIRGFIWNGAAQLKTILPCLIGQRILAS